MFKNLINYLTSIFHTVKKKDVITTINNAFIVIEEDIIPTLQQVEEVTDIKQVKDSKLLSVARSMLDDKPKDNKEFIKRLNLFFTNIVANKKLLLDIVNKHVNDVLSPNSVEVREAAILKVCNDISSITLFVLDLIYVSIRDEKYSELSKAKLEEVSKGSVSFAEAYNEYYKNYKNILTKLPTISEDRIDANNVDNLTEMRVHNSGSVINLPGMQGFVGNPIYTLGMWLVDRQMEKLEALKEKKKLLELRLSELKLQDRGQGDEKLMKAIQYYEDKIDNLEYKIRKLEDRD